MSDSNQHQDRRAEAWSRIDTTKTEDMVPSSELRGWLAEYVGLFEQLEAAQRRADDQAEKFQRETLLSNRLASVVNAVREYQLARAGGTLQEQSDAWLRVDVALVDSNPAYAPQVRPTDSASGSLLQEPQAGTQRSGSPSHEETMPASPATAEDGSRAVGGVSSPASEPETGTCADCGRSLTTEEAIRSDACPECDPTKPYVSPRYSDEPGGSHGLDSR